MAKSEWRPRLSVNITPEQYKRLQDNIDWGIRGKLIMIVLDDVLDAIETHGPDVIGGLLSRKIKAADITPELNIPTFKM